MGYNKPYAKPCKFCKTVQVVWDEKLEGPNKFKEVQTNIQHTRERCDAAKNTPVEQQVPMFNPQQQKEFVEGFGYMSKPQQKSEQQTSTNDFQLAQLITKVDNLSIGMAKIMSMIQTLNDLSMNAEDISRLRTENAELKDVLKKREDNFIPANKVPTDNQEGYEYTEKEPKPDYYDQHVRDMVEKGRQANDDEELDLT